MKTKFLTILIVFSVSNIFAQTDSLKLKKNIANLIEKVDSLERNVKGLQSVNSNYATKQEIEDLKNQIDTIQSVNSKILQENESFKKSQAILVKNYKQLNNEFETYKQNTSNMIDSFQQIINSNSANIQTTANELKAKIEDTHMLTNQNITDLNKTVGQNTLYWIVAILFVALFSLLVFVFLRKQIFKQKTDLDSNLQDARKALEEKGVKLDNKLVEVLETQLKIINNSNTGTEKEADHTLALKVADEIIRIQKNLTRMDDKTKGLKQLTASVKRIQDSFASNGYELVEMLGRKYDEGMKASVTYNPDSDEQSGIIIRIIKPQVNFKNEMIQAAQIEVGE